MDEAELTRKAIEEIMVEMNAQNEAQKLPQMLERKCNPLRRPNKDFLDRTLNSVMTHNKRQLERNRRKCQSKLRDMDEARASKQIEYRGREKDRRKRKKKLKRKNSQSSTTSSSSNYSSISKERKDKNKRSKKLKNRTKKRANSSSSSSLSTSTLSLDVSNTSTHSSSSKKKRKRQKKTSKVEYDMEYLDPTSIGCYVDPNLAWAAMAYSQMNQLIHQQQQAVQLQLMEALKYEGNDNVEVEQDIPSDLSLTYHSSESELNITLNSSSAEEDEHGVLTFKLTSDEERTSNKPPIETIRKRKEHVSRKNKSNSKQSSAIGETLLITTSESDDTSDIESPRKMEEITISSSSSSSESDHDLDKRKEMITTILSSSSSSEAEDDENAIRQEEITILSSSSEVEEGEVLEKKDQGETEIINITSSRVVESNKCAIEADGNAAICHGIESETSNSNEMLEKNKSQSEKHLTEYTEENDLICTANDEKQDRDNIDQQEAVENTTRQEPIKNFNKSINAERHEKLEERDLEETLINTLNPTKVATPDKNGNAALCQGNELEANARNQFICTEMIQEGSHQTLLSEDKDMKSITKDLLLDDNQVSNESDRKTTEELMQTDSEKKEVQEYNHDLDCASQTTSSPKAIVNNSLMHYNNEKAANIRIAKDSVEVTSDINKLDLNEACVRQSDDAQKEVKISRTSERDLNVEHSSMRNTIANERENLVSNTSESSPIRYNRIDLNNEKEVDLMNENRCLTTTENPELETKRELISNENIEFISKTEGKQL